MTCVAQTASMPLKIIDDFYLNVWQCDCAMTLRIGVKVQEPPKGSETAHSTNFELIEAGSSSEL